MYLRLTSILPLTFLNAIPSSLLLRAFCRYAGCPPLVAYLPKSEEKYPVQTPPPPQAPSLRTLSSAAVRTS